MDSVENEKGAEQSGPVSCEIERSPAEASKTNKCHKFKFGFHSCRLGAVSVIAQINNHCPLMSLK